MLEIKGLLRIAGSLSGMVLVRLVGVLLTFAVGITIARLGGPAMLGAFQLYNTWMVTLAEVGGMGLPTVALREVSKQHNRTSWRNTRDFIAKIVGMGVSGMLLVSLLIVALIALFSFLSADRLPVHILIAIPASISFLALRIHVESLKGQGKRIQAVIKESALVPLVLILLLVAGETWGVTWSGKNIAIVHAFIISALVFGSLFLMGILKRSLKELSLPKPTLIAQDSRSLWLGSLINLSLLYLPFYFLPWYSDESGTGIFSAAYRLVMIAVTLLIVIAAWFGPRMARAYANNDHQGLKMEIRQARWFSVLGYLPFFLLCWFFGDHLLAMFGEAFRGSTDILLILCLGQLVNALTGLPGLHLNMVGLSRIETTISVTSLAIGALLHLILGSLWGSLGIAVAFTLTVSLKNITSFAASRLVLSGKANKAISKHINSYSYIR